MLWLAPTKTIFFYLLTLSSQRYSIAWLEVKSFPLTPRYGQTDGRTDKCIMIATQGRGIESIIAAGLFFFTIRKPHKCYQILSLCIYLGLRTRLDKLPSDLPYSRKFWRELNLPMAVWYAFQPPNLNPPILFNSPNRQI